MFCEEAFFANSDVSSNSPNGGSGLAVLYVVLLRFSMESSSAACRAWLFSMMGRLSISVILHSYAAGDFLGGSYLGFIDLSTISSKLQLLAL